MSLSPSVFLLPPQAHLGDQQRVLLAQDKGDRTYGRHDRPPSQHDGQQRPWRRGKARRPMAASTASATVQAAVSADGCRVLIVDERAGESIESDLGTEQVGWTAGAQSGSRLTTLVTC